MFNSNKRDDSLTREEASEYAASFQQALNALDERVQELENLARELRRGGRPVTPAAQRSNPASSDALTKRDAEQALTSLRNAGAEEFARLHAKLDRAVTAVSQSARAGALRDVATNDVATGVDYGAVAFGLSQVKRDVSNVLGSEVRGNDLTEHYRQTVQYFADVFAKSDPSFDARLFKSQAGA